MENVKWRIESYHFFELVLAFSIIVTKMAFSTFVSINVNSWSGLLTNKLLTV
jgi:hypothetical protein